MTEYIVEAKDIVKSFPGVRALDGVDLRVAPGEIHGLVGENGAGKTTLISILGGIYQPNKGEIYIDGQKFNLNSPLEAARAGISVVHQEPSLAPNLTVAENIFPTRQPVGRLGTIDTRKLRQQTQEMLAVFHAEDIDPGAPVKQLPVSQQQLVEILKALAFNPKVLILDEPTAALTDKERELLFTNIRHMKEKGMSVIYISHHLKEIFEVCDRVTILKDGKLVCEANVKDIDEDFLIRNMVGREIVDIYGYEKSFKDTNPVLEVRHISRRGFFQDINFSVKPGEIVGFYGLVGAGRTEMGRAIFGMEPIDEGEIYLDGKRVQSRSVNDAIKLGIGYLTEDRKLLGLYLSKSIKDNLISNHLADFVIGGTLNNRLIDSFAARCIRDFAIVTPNAEQVVNNLSGGNQQKVLVSIWLGMEPKVLIVDEPTKGVDIGARSDIYKLLRQLARKGAGIIMISSDLLETIGLSDRIIVIKEGEIVGNLTRDEANEERVVALAAGAALTI